MLSPQQIVSKPIVLFVDGEREHGPFRSWNSHKCTSHKASPMKTQHRELIDTCSWMVYERPMDDAHEKERKSP